MAQGLLHGEAVATGLVLATHLSAPLGLCPQEDTSRVAAHLQSVGLPTQIAGLPAERLLAHMKQDKKMRGGRLTFVLTRGIGQAFTEQRRAGRDGAGHIARRRRSLKPMAGGAYVTASTGVSATILTSGLRVRG